MIQRVERYGHSNSICIDRESDNGLLMASYVYEITSGGFRFRGLNYYHRTSKRNNFKGGTNCNNYDGLPAPTDSEVTKAIEQLLSKK